MDTLRRRACRAGSGFLFAVSCAALVTAHGSVFAQALVPAPDMYIRWLAATLDGHSTLAIASARALADSIDDETLRTVPTTAGFRMVPYYALTRFGHWREMLDEPEPPEFNLVLRAAWYYARGLSYVATGQTARAEGELAWLRILLQDEVMQQPLSSPNSAGAGRGDRGGEEAVRRGHRASQDGRTTGGQPRPCRAARVSLPAAPRARRDPARGQASGGSRGGLSARSGSPARERVGALRVDAGAARARQDRGGRAQ